MDKSIEKYIRNRSKILLAISIIMIIISGSMFPLIPFGSQVYESLPLYMKVLMFLLRVQLIHICYTQGRFISKLHRFKELRFKKFQIFLIFFTISLVGLLVRVWIEWGEATLVENLTIANIFVHLMFIPAVVLISYIVTKNKKS